MSKVFAAELCAETNLMSLFEHLLLELNVAESATVFVACSGQVVVVVSRSELNGEQVLFGTGTSDDEADVVRRAGCRAEGFHLGHEEGHERGGVEDGFGFLVEVRLVGRASAFGDAEEFVLHSLGGFEVNLCRQVAAGVHLVVHVERSVLRVAQVLLGIGLVNAFGDGLFVAESRPYLLSFFTVYDGGACVLADGQLSFGCHFGVAQEGKGHVFVVVGCFRIAEDLGHLEVV